MKFLDIVKQSSPPSISRTFSPSPTEVLYPLNTNSTFSPPLAGNNFLKTDVGQMIKYLSSDLFILA